MILQVDVAPEQQPAASSAASETHMQKLAELTQGRAALIEPATSVTLRSRSSNLAQVSEPEDTTVLPAAASEPVDVGHDATPSAKMAASKASIGERFLAESLQPAQLPDEALLPSPDSKASGLTKYRAPTAPLQRSKLESFDRKIGRAANSQQVDYESKALPAPLVT